MNVIRWACFKGFLFFRSGANVQYAIFITQTRLTIQTRTYERGYREEQIFNPALFVFAVYLEVEKSRCAGEERFTIVTGRLLPTSITLRGACLALTMPGSFKLWREKKTVLLCNASRMLLHYGLKRMAGRRRAMRIRT